MNNTPLIETQEPNQIDYSAQMKIAKDSIVSFMELEKIPMICYIDDRADISSLKSEYIGAINAIYNSSVKPEELGFVDWSMVPQAKFLSKISEDWEVFSSEQKKDNFLKLSVYNKDSNFIPALMIQNILGEKIKLFSPKEWVEDEYNIIKTLNDGEKILCLFDIEFEGEAKLENGRDGLDLAKQLLDSEHLDSCVCGVFSHKFSIEEEDDKRNEYSEQKELPKNKFYTISKERFAYDPKISAFAEGIKNLILLPYIEGLKNKSISTFEATFLEAKNRISNISPKTFNQIVQKSSLKEGIWEVNTLFRLFNIISKEENLNHISIQANKESYITGIKKIREIDIIETGYEYNNKNQQLIDLRNSELHIKGETINKLHFPISNGDIFSINEKEYILLVQPCNLAIRASKTDFGKRNYDYKNAIIVPLKIKDKSQYKKSISHEILEFPNFDGVIKYADFSNFKTTSLDLLDLVVFNEDGSAKIDMNIRELSNELIHTPWLKRYSYIYKELKKFENGLIHFNNIKSNLNNPNNSDYNSLKNFIYAPECLKDLKINDLDIYDFNTKVFKFKVKRTSHYKSPYSDDLLQKFMQYLSRNAFDHDFTNS